MHVDAFGEGAYAATATHASSQAKELKLQCRFRPGSIFPPLATLDPPVSKREGEVNFGIFLLAPRLTIARLAGSTIPWLFPIA
jgi:hypothetical protein